MSSTKPGSSKADDVDFWLNHLRAWQGTGRAMSLYARKHGLNPDDFYRWKKRLLNLGRWPENPKQPANPAPSNKPTFIRATVAAHDTVVCRVRFPNGIVVDVNAGLPHQTLKAVLQSVGGMP